MSIDSTVPAELVGLWRRRSLVDAHGCDRSTEVYWLQTHSLYADLRLPANRPGFSGCAGIHDLDYPQIDWLARQQGFAGRLLLDGDIATWVRELDYQPPGLDRDVGRLDRRATTMFEYGVVRAYTEKWVREPGPADQVLALALTDDSTQCFLPPRKGMVVVVGDHFMHARGRRVSLPPGTTLASLLQDSGDDTASASLLLDCVIDYGCRHGGQRPWQIQRSTQPWREGSSLLDLDLAVRSSQPDSVETVSAAGVRCRWRIVEGHGGLLNPY